MAHRRAPVSDPRNARRTAVRRRRPWVTLACWVAAVVLLLACASADAQSTRTGADRLRVTPRRDQVPFDVQADATATGTVARPDATTLTGGRSTARLLVTALPRTRHCPRSTPTADTPHTDTYDLYETRFTEVLDIPDATEVARKC